MQLQGELAGYREAGLGVVAISYDDPALQQAFVEAAGIDYPLLSDNEAQTFLALDILNTEYQPGHGAYGIPYPGTLVLDREQVVRAKVFVEGYETRVSAEQVLEVAREALK